MSTTLTERILSSYKQAFQYWFMSIIYSIIAMIVIFIGIGQMGTAIDDFSGSGFYVGLLIVAIGFFLFIIGFFAAFLYAATRGGESGTPLGFIEAYSTTFKLIAELAIAIIFGIVLFLLGAQIGGGLAVLFYLVGGVTFLLFPYASLFYVINYLSSR